MSVNTAVAKPGCGCGGSAGGGCGCGGACGNGSVPANLTATAFVRPRFFAGQLLTEDDLSALTAYTTAKDRLHNRYLFGAGVVCGLWVSCDPCGGGTVTVQPGYALDCCGNDLMLSCAATLDVNAMIRDLRTAQLGKDCGDPCAGRGTASSGHQNATSSRRYCLYARYGEQSTDPVAAYATGEPCGQVSCEPTRIREGISFVLKCPVDAPAPDDLWTRISACLPSPDVLDGEARLSIYSGPMTTAAATAEHPPPFSPEDAEELTNIRAVLAKEQMRTEEQHIRAAIEDVRRLAALVAKYDLARERTEYEDIGPARNELGQAANVLAGAPAAAGYDHWDQLAVNALLEQAAKLADRSATLPRVLLAMLAQGRPLDDSVLAALASQAGVVLEWLLDRLDNDPTLAHCELRTRALALSLTTPAKSDAREIQSLGRGTSELAELVAGIVRDCICTAFDPPCAPCEDTDVLLACLEVCDCTVVRICNAERDHVMSGSALRYWLPTGPLHEWLESFYCPPDRGKDLLDLQNPGQMVRDVLERMSTARAAPSVAQPPHEAGAADADDTSQQVATLARRMTELTEQLTQSRARLDKAEATLDETREDLRKAKDELGETRASLGALRSQPQAAPASPKQARTRQRGSAVRRPAAAAAQAPADAGEVSEAVAGPNVPETSDDDT